MSAAQSVVDSGAAATPGDAFPNLGAYIPGDRRRALAQGTPMPDRVRGAALFADISGFTPLTEALGKELGPQRAAEELTAQLNRVFHALISDLERYGGHVIYFSGDAITCWIDGDDGLRATACALAMQETIGQSGDVVTPAGMKVRLAMKVAVSVGAARRFLVGDPSVQRIDVLAGRLIDELAGAEHQAEKGEVVLDRSALESLGDRVEIREMRVEEDGWREFGVVERLTVPVEAPPAPAPENPLPEALAREWLLPDIFERLRAGRGEFLAELRPAYPVFLRFGGIDYDDDDDAIDKLDDFIREVQRMLASYGGNLLHLTLGDKGAYLYAVFGSPRGHEDDAARAAAAALELRALQATTAARNIQIGITYGRLRSGTYGHKDRQTFTCIGGAVNLAARLMAKAPPGRIYVAEDVRRAAGDVFTWQQLSALAVKGKGERVAVFVLTGSKRHANRGRAGYEFPLVGREAELEAFGARARRGACGSRADRRHFRRSRHGQVAARGRVRPEGRGAGRRRGGRRVPVVRHQHELLRLARGMVDAVPSRHCPTRDGAGARARGGARRDRSGARPARSAARRRCSTCRFPTTTLTAQFDAKLRKTSLEGLLVECLRARAAEAPLRAGARGLPLARPAVARSSRGARPRAGELACAHRARLPSERERRRQARHREPPAFHRDCARELDDEAAAQLIRVDAWPDRAGAESSAPAALVRARHGQGAGQPLLHRGAAQLHPQPGRRSAERGGAASNLQLPESLHSLILSRIDTLGESPRRTLKVASVPRPRVSRADAARRLSGAWRGRRMSVSTCARSVEADLVNVDPEVEQTYLFKQVVTQEVAYESMPFALRSMLHERCGRFIEATEPDAIERNLDLLAHHYWHSENLPKKREYLGRAGDAAQASYANPAAIDYFERLAPLVEQGARVDVLLKLGKVLELVGNWRRAEQVEGEAMALAEDLADDHSKASCEDGAGRGGAQAGPLRRGDGAARSRRERVPLPG